LQALVFKLLLGSAQIILNIGELCIFERLSLCFSVAMVLVAACLTSRPALLVGELLNRILALHFFCERPISLGVLLHFRMGVLQRGEVGSFLLFAVVSERNVLGGPLGSLFRVKLLAVVWVGTLFVNLRSD